MHRFQIFEMTDVAGKSPLGEVVVEDDGALRLEAGGAPSHADRLGRAIADVGSARTLRLSTREAAPAGGEGVSVLKVREVGRDDAAYAWAVVDALARSHGLRCAAVEEPVEGW